ncbi:MAG: hypothetical protein P4M15_07775 [Alphaproteobacteria bacterium]|nr:hypothetical protein [Alphaproteobacteria bacterium]
MISIKRALRHTALAVALVAPLAGCANMNSQQQSMLSGGAVGTVVGAAGTVLTGGCVACGAAIGGAVGVAGGYVVDQMHKN